MADVLVHGGEGGDGGGGPDQDAAQLAVGLEGACEGVVPLGLEEGEAVLTGPLGHDDGGGAFGELNEVHDEELEG